jgi:hypothetical protein
MVYLNSWLLFTHSLSHCYLYYLNDALILFFFSLNCYLTSSSDYFKSSCLDLAQSMGCLYYYYFNSMTLHLMNSMCLILLPCWLYHGYNYYFGFCNSLIHCLYTLFFYLNHLITSYLVILHLLILTHNYYAALCGYMLRMNPLCQLLN